MSRLPVFSLVHSNFRDGTADFLIDTGSQLNLIKQKLVISDKEIDTSIIYNLTGIDSGNIPTKGEILCKFTVLM